MDTEQNKNVEEILNSLDGCTKAAAPDFFYTRLRARLDKETIQPAPQSWLLRPAFAVMALVVVLVLNAFVLFQRNKTNSSFTASDTDNLQSVAAEYSLNDNSNLYDLAQDNR
jgi:hypothetical protein